MQINKQLLPIKMHFFFFMAAMAPLLPQLPVLGKELGVSSIVMGTITGILPILFLFAKPVFGMLVDVYRDYRKTIFMFLILIMVMAFALLNFVPQEPRIDVSINGTLDSLLEPCDDSITLLEEKCNKQITRVVCTSQCFNRSSNFLMTSPNKSLNTSQQPRLCYFKDDKIVSNSINSTTSSCAVNCINDFENISSSCLYGSFTFWSFLILMSVGSIGYNVVNSISDAICFDVIGDEYNYGKQRVWGTIGWGLSALISGYAVDFFSGTSITYAPAIIIMIIFFFIDFAACSQLELPIIEAPKNIFKDIKELMNNRHVITFITFAVFAGIIDSFIIYYLFWYLEDLAAETHTKNIKLLEGLVLAAETLGGEVIFFSLSGKILSRFGHVHCFSMCFITYALRYALISVAPSPWYIVPIEFIFQGPTYAMTYTTIVEYANQLAPPGASATMQGIAAGMDDGFGYAIGSFLGGILYKYLGGRNAMQVFSFLGVIFSISHLVLHKTLLKKTLEPTANNKLEYKSPEDAMKMTYNHVNGNVS